MMEFRVLSATGMLGSGFMESSFERGILLKPHVIAPEEEKEALVWTPETARAVPAKP